MFLVTFLPVSFRDCTLQTLSQCSSHMSQSARSSSFAPYSPTSRILLCQQERREVVLACRSL
jgi:hypothetical protein